jgi:hypothetical protein
LIEEPNSRKSRAERVRYLREGVLELSRAKMAKRFEGLAEGTLQTWEYGHHGGLTEKGAKLLVQAADSMGVKCTIEWLLYGIGEKPFSGNPKFKESDQPRKSESEVVIEELHLLRETYPHIVDAIVNDDGMAPCFLPGDYVAGERCFGEKILTALGKACIVQTQTGVSMVRLVKSGNSQQGYTLSCVNPSTTVREFQLEQVALFSAAPILWLRRKKGDDF